MKPWKFEKPLIMSHRGFQTHYPENTMVSFMAAAGAGAQFVELDVTLTRDHQVAFISKYFHSKETVSLCKELDVFSYHPNLAYLSSEQVNVLHKAGIRVFPYNINDKKDIYRCFALGADGLIAKNPHLARQCYNPTHQRA